MILTRGFVVAFCVMQGLGFILFTTYAYRSLRENYKMMQGMMKFIVQVYFWIKLLTFSMLMILFALENKDEQQEKSRHMLQIG